MPPLSTETEPTILSEKPKKPIFNIVKITCSIKINFNTFSNNLKFKFFKLTTEMNKINGINNSLINRKKLRKELENERDENREKKINKNINQ